MRQEAVNAALIKAYNGGLSPEDCKTLDADEAEEVARILIEVSKKTRAAKP